MIVIKYRKISSPVYVSHVDTMRILQRTLIRANIDVKYSEGFNPHPITYCSHPLPLGIKSECEYFVISNDNSDTENILSRFNEKIPKGMEAEYAIRVSKNPNLAAVVNRCEYSIKSKTAYRFKNELNVFTELATYSLTFKFKDSFKTIDIAPLLHTIDIDENGIKMVVSSGNPNLRPDRLIEEWNSLYPLNIDINDITRTNQLIASNDIVINADEYIKGLKA